MANHRVDDVATPEGFARNPQLVYEFYNQRRRQLLTPEISPNAAHSALAKFEHEFDGEFLLVTQNVDNLHEHFENPVKMNGCRYLPPEAPGYSTTMHADSLDYYDFPGGKAWSNR